MIFFDIDGTLVDHRFASHEGATAFQAEYASELTGTPDEFAWRWHKVAEVNMRRYFDGELTYAGQRRARLRALFAHKRRLTDEEADSMFELYLEHYAANWRLFDDAGDALSMLAGRELGIISNGASEQQRRKLSSLGIDHLFETVVISGDIGAAKPERRIFEHACRIAGREPSECWYVGDDLRIDAEAAVEAGMRGVWLDRSGMSCEVLVPVIAELTALPSVVDSAHDE